MNDTIKLEYTVSGEDFTRAGEASSDLENMLKQLGVSPDLYLPHRSHHDPEGFRPGYT